MDNKPDRPPVQSDNVATTLCAKNNGSGHQRFTQRPDYGKQLQRIERLFTTLSKECQHDGFKQL
nr:hypothetical protein 25Ep1_00056 [Serratia proteamaculans]ULG17268.1 hypothetical protein 10novelp1_00055 [Serratia proteamaculans]ULG17623.1 hypothetical protein Ep_00054 [Serratia proteamaculans]ULG17836.1 hypothetical protein Gp1_00056 [Serratia proteamaculans]